MENVKNSQAQPKSLVLQSKELQLMKISFDDILKIEEYDVLKGPLKNPAINMITFDDIGSKFNSYTNINEYLKDIQSLVRSYASEYSSNVDVENALISLSERCHRDVNSIQRCLECFERWTIDASTYFTLACSKPHLIVFAKARGYKYWPAKVMSIKRDEVNVEFFGDHTQADVPVKKCLLYPKRITIQGKRTTIFNEALMEVEDHITKIEQKFGTFVPAGPGVLIDPSRFDQQLRDMFPTAYQN